jgi:virulence factor BrkB
VYDAINASVDKIFSSSSAGLPQRTGTAGHVAHGEPNGDDDAPQRGPLLLDIVDALEHAHHAAHPERQIPDGQRRGEDDHAPLGLGLAIGLVVRFAPAQKPDSRWASAGSLLVIVVWIVATLLFKLWIAYVANFKSAIGTLTGLLLLTTYFFVSSAIFIVGAELDELLRKETRGRGLALPDLVTAVVRR